MADDAQTGSLKKKHMSKAELEIVDRAMAYALDKWNKDLIVQAIDAGADCLPLVIRAIDKGDADVLKLAFDKGVSPSVPFKDSRQLMMTPLHYAHQHFDKAVIEEILSRGVGIDELSLCGRGTVAEQALGGAALDQMLYYISKGADMDRYAQKILVEGVSVAKIAAVNWAITKGADIHAKIAVSNTKDKPLFHLACEFWSYTTTQSIVKTFLAKGVHPDVEDSDGMTALMKAALRPNRDKALPMDLIQDLLGAGADPFKRDKLNKSAIDHLLVSKDCINESSMQIAMELMLRQVGKIYTPEPEPDHEAGPDTGLGAGVRVLKKLTPKT